jgi:hypothetical protein
MQSLECIEPEPRFTMKAPERACEIYAPAGARIPAAAWGLSRTPASAGFALIDNG